MDSTVIAHGRGTGQHRRRGSGRVRWVGGLSIGIGFGLLLTITLCDLLATPRIAFQMNTRLNRGTVSLTKGTGPLAGLVLRHSHLAIRAWSGSAKRFELAGQAEVAVPPGNYTALQAHVRGPVLFAEGWQSIPIGRHAFVSSVNPRRVGPVPAAKPTMQPVARTKPGSPKTGTVTSTSPAEGNSPTEGTRTTQTTPVPRWVGATERVAVANTAGMTAPGDVISRADALIEQVTPVPEVWFASSANGQVYITMDDGWYVDPGVLALMKEDHVPVTTFLIQDAAAEHLSFWRAFVAAGGTIEDHTVNHPDLSKMSAVAAKDQWVQAADGFQQWFGTRPTLGRPPYGAVNPHVLSEAGAAGLQDVVMWSASFNPNKRDGRLQTYDGKPLRAGEIILLHWEPGVVQELQQVLKACQQLNLVPAPLLSGLVETQK